MRHEGRAAWIAVATAVLPWGCAQPADEPGQPERTVTDLVRSEEVADAVGKAVKATLVRGIRERKLDLVRSALAEDFRGSLPEPERWVEDGAVRLWRLPARAPADLDRARFLARLERMLSQFAAIERASWRAFRSLAAERGGAVRGVSQSVHFALAGARRDGRRAELHATVEAELVPRQATWRLHSLTFERATWTESALPVFRDVAQAAGFDFNPSDENRRIVQSLIDDRALLTAGGLTALDFDRDGFWDVLASYWDREAVLFMNDRQGGFRPTPLPLIDRPEQVSKFYLWLDLDEDGREELVGTQVLAYRDQEAELGVYTWKGGRMKRLDGALRFAIPAGMRRINFEGITACDADRDGRLDLIFIGYDHQDSKDRARLIDEARDGLRNLLFMNRGGLRFAEEGVERGLSATQYSFVAECRDFDGDGDPDLFVGNDYGRNNYYENTGDGRFREDLRHPFHLGASFSMGIAIADWDNRGELAMSVSNMYSHAGQRIIPLAEGLSRGKRKSLLLLASGNSLYERVGGRWTDKAAEYGLDDAGWAWGNAFFDFDNDGDKDLWVVNGYTTHSDPDLPDY